MRIKYCAAAFAPLVAIATVGVAFVASAVLGWKCGDAVGYDRSAAQAAALIFGSALWFILLFSSLMVLYGEPTTSSCLQRFAITLLVVPAFVAAALIIVVSIGLWGCGLGGLVGDQWYMVWAPSLAALLMLLIGIVWAVCCACKLRSTGGEDERDCLYA